MYLFNVYDLEWNYLGCFWNALPLGLDLGGYFREESFSGPFLSSDGRELSQIEPIDVYIKLIEQCS